MLQRDTSPAVPAGKAPVKHGVSRPQEGARMQNDIHNKLKNEKDTYLTIVIIVAVVMLAMWIATPFIHGLLSCKFAEMGQLGDTFGSINALFSGFAFVAVIYAILLQRKELQLQREEMISSRKELAEQAKIQRAQFDATVCQLKVEASKIRVQGSKIKAETSQGDMRGSNLKRISDEADHIEKIIDLLEKKHNG